MRNFDFNNDTSENIFSHLRISYMVNRRLQGEEQFHSKNYLLEMPRSHVEMDSKNAPQKLNFAMAKIISKIQDSQDIQDFFSVFHLFVTCRTL